MISKFTKLITGLLNTVQDGANMMVFLMWRGILLSIRTKRLAVVVKEEVPRSGFSGFASLHSTSE